MNALSPQESVQVVEALLFASAEPVDEASIAARLPEDTDIRALLAELAGQYDSRGVNLVCVAGKWTFRTASEIAPHLNLEREAERKLSRAGVETLAIIAYHQPVTRAEIEEIRGVAVNRGTLDVLLETSWIKPGRRRDTPGRPVTWLTTDDFLSHFGLESLNDLPGQKELAAAGLLDTRPAISVYAARATDSVLPESLEEAGAGDDVPEPLNTPEHQGSQEQMDGEQEPAEVADGA
jgi:segregation and condensation protein B